MKWNSTILRIKDIGVEKLPLVVGNLTGHIMGYSFLDKLIPLHAYMIIKVPYIHRERERETHQMHLIDGTAPKIPEREFFLGGPDIPLLVLVMMS